jgi:hypothetical protein
MREGRTGRRSAKIQGGEGMSARTTKAAENAKADLPRLMQACAIRASPIPRC